MLVRHRRELSALPWTRALFVRTLKRGEEEAIRKGNWWQGYRHYSGAKRERRGEGKRGGLLFHLTLRGQTSPVYSVLTLGQTVSGI